MRSQQDQAGRHDQPSQHVRLQRTCREWPSCRRIAKTLDEFALSHVTSSSTCLAQSLNYNSLEPPASDKCQLPVSGGGKPCAQEQQPRKPELRKPACILPEKSGVAC